MILVPQNVFLELEQPKLRLGFESKFIIVLEMGRR
jgi:hypothetical protein